ncbi:MAG: tRNA-dihydrouridine synthase [Pseudomonadota bacterium]
MVTTGALIHGDAARYLDFSTDEHPVALQLAGSDPADLALCAKLGEQWGYAEINLNCGCPSERVQRGAFGACLMAEPALVADCLKAMQDVVSVPVSVKHRIGIDTIEDYSFVRDFVGYQHHIGCRVFIVHTRNAILKGLTPKENREIPPLRYEVASQLKADFPDSEIIINGGIETVEAVRQHWQAVDGVMIGREAYHRPELLFDLEQCLQDPLANIIPLQQCPEAAIELRERMVVYLANWVNQGNYAGAVTRHWLGLHRGQKGSRLWRQIFSDHKKLAQLTDETSVRRFFGEGDDCLRV